MAFTEAEFNDYELGYTKGVIGAENGVPELELLQSEPNVHAREGIKAGYSSVTGISLSDSLKSLRDAHAKFISDSSKGSKLEIIERSLDIKDCCEEEPNVVVIVANDVNEVAKFIASTLSQDMDGLSPVATNDYGSGYYSLTDSSEDDYTLNKVNNNHYQVMKNGEPAYDLTKKKVNWQCSCPGFKYRGICKHIQMLQDVLPKRRNINDLKAFVPEIEKMFEPQFGPIYNESTKEGRWAIVGSYRRNKPTVKDIDILVECPASDFESKVLPLLEADPNYKNTMHGTDIIRGTYNGWDFDVSRVEPGQWASYLLYRTGNSNFNINMRALVKKKGMSLNEHGLFDRETGKLITNESEEAIFNALGLEFLPPEKREF